MISPTKKGLFITVEGIEGAGKSTAIKLIEKFLKSKQINYITTREPGGTTIAEELREIVLTQRKEKLTMLSELLLIFAARSQNIELVIKPALAKGTWVVGDRFTDATYAYQGAGRGLPQQYIQTLEQMVQTGLKPERIFLLDVPVECGLARARNRGEPDRIESEQLEFFNRVREGYLNRARQHADEYHVIDASQSLDNVEKELYSALDSLLASQP